MIIAIPAAWKLGEIGGATVGQHDAAEAMVVRLAHRRVDTDLGGDAAHKKGIDTSVVQYQIKVGLIERAPLPGLSTTGSPGAG